MRVPPAPPQLIYLWNAFRRLSDRRGMGLSGSAPLTWPEIDAFSRLSGLHLAPWEIEIVEELDRLFLFPPKPAE
ncbi:hypothetical protein [Bosea sp. LC85]|uniref:phage tail assembly chaperone n=1 Tax=Bosea sp. LC85 TaxID=1502851 RepID=UPI001FCB9895|nr:hypothetical protein [Bosea sp. LC85]